MENPSTSNYEYTPMETSIYFHELLAEPVENSLKDSSKWGTKNNNQEKGKERRKGESNQRTVILADSIVALAREREQVHAI